MISVIIICKPVASARSSPRRSSPGLDASTPLPVKWRRQRCDWSGLSAHGKENPALAEVRPLTLHEGLSVQILHLGPYDTEGPSSGNR
jgi:hypothetical protein